MLRKILQPHPTIYKYDRTWIGILLGLIVPLAGIGIVYLISLGNHFLRVDKPDIITSKQLLRSMSDFVLLMRYMSVGCMLSLGVFFLFINRDYFKITISKVFSCINRFIVFAFKVFSTK